LVLPRVIIHGQPVAIITDENKICGGFRAFFIKGAPPPRGWIGIKPICRGVIVLSNEDDENGFLDIRLRTLLATSNKGLTKIFIENYFEKGIQLGSSWTGGFVLNCSARSLKIELCWR